VKDRKLGVIGLIAALLVAFGAFGLFGLKLGHDPPATTTMYVMTDDGVVALTATQIDTVQGTITTPSGQSYEMDVSVYAVTVDDGLAVNDGLALASQTSTDIDGVGTSDGKANTTALFGNTDDAALYAQQTAPDGDTAVTPSSSIWASATNVLAQAYMTATRGLGSPYAIVLVLVLSFGYVAIRRLATVDDFADLLAFRRTALTTLLNY